MYILYNCFKGMHVLQNWSQFCFLSHDDDSWMSALSYLLQQLCGQLVDLQRTEIRIWEEKRCLVEWRLKIWCELKCAHKAKKNLVCVFSVCNTICGGGDQTVNFAWTQFTSGQLSKQWGFWLNCWYTQLNEIVVSLFVF